MTLDFKKICVTGAGAWGTALANLLARKGYETLIWALEPDCAAAINEAHVNSLYLPDIPLDPRLKATTDLADIKGSDAVLLVAPAQFMRVTLQKLKPFVSADLPMILCSKGIELGSLSLMTDVLKAELPEAIPAVLSGPSFAKDVAIGLPTAVTLAAEDPKIASQLAEMMRSATFRPYISHDLIGAEIGGAVKNVLAIACGIVLGMGLGRSAHAAIMARGFAEMRRLAIALGGQEATLQGLCGLGDLVLTCSSEQSRNMSFGLAVGQGQKPQDILSARTAVTEGASTAPALETLSKNLGVEMPICQAVADIIRGDIDVKTAVASLLARPLTSEI